MALDMPAARAEPCGTVWALTIRVGHSGRTSSTITTPSLHCCCPTSKTGLSFSVDKPDAVQAQARSAAIADAQSKANELAKELGVKTLAEDPNVEYLFYVGCAGSFFDRGKKVTVAFAKILQAAGVSFGILGTEESCCGDSAMRGGNEYLYQTLAQMNIEAMNGYGVKKIIATCPHGYNALKKDYPHFGGNFDVAFMYLIGSVIASTVCCMLLPKNKPEIQLAKAVA